MYSILDLLADYGGMDAAICLFISPVLAGFVARSFDYDLVTKHMMVKQRTKKKA